MSVNTLVDAFWPVRCIFFQSDDCSREIKKECFLHLSLLFLLCPRPLVLCYVFIMCRDDFPSITCLVLILLAADISHRLTYNQLLTCSIGQTQSNSRHIDLRSHLYILLSWRKITNSVLTYNKCMFSKHIEKISHLLINGKEDEISLADSFRLPTHRTSRNKIQPSRISSSTPKPRYQSEIVLIKEDLPKKYAKILNNLFKAKCNSLHIDFNETNWNAFLKAFVNKNKFKDDEICNQTLNLSESALGEDCIPHINQFLKQNPSLIIIKLCKNVINPNLLFRLATFKEVQLGNCRLGNDILEKLFRRLQTSCIQRLYLSSPQLKNRNQLTKYKELISLIQTSTTLHTLELANMDIQPDSLIIETCKNSNVKHLDISDNTGSKGISPTLLSLNLSRNSIVVPFTYPMLPNELQFLDLSYNKIPCSHFKEFLKFSYFSSLKKLVVDHIRLDGDLSCFQYFLQQSLSMAHLSMVNCDLIQTGFLCIAHGVKHSRSLQLLNLSWNRISNEKIGDYISHMIQGCSLKQIRLKHCDIKDNIGHILFRNLRKNKTIEKIDVMNNLLGDKTSKTICSELKFNKTLTSLFLEENIIKYSDIQEISSYLQSNKFFSVHQIDKEYRKLQQTNTQIAEANIIINTETERIGKLEKQTEALHQDYLKKFKLENQERKKKLRNDIYNIRDRQNQLMMDITLLQALPSLSQLNSIESRKESFISNHQSFNNL